MTDITTTLQIIGLLIFLTLGRLIYIAILLHIKNKKNIAVTKVEKTTYSPPKSQIATKNNNYESKSKTTSSQKSNELTLELLKKIEWKQFEYVCAAILQELGLRTETIQCGADGGIDIKTYKEGSIHPDAIVQCKSWKTKQVGITTIRELLGVMTDSKVKEGIFMITHEFHKDAITFAKNNNIYLHDGKEIIDIIKRLPEKARHRIYNLATQGDYATPTCPSCGIKMVKKEKFWGCVNFPKGCKAKIWFK